MNENNIQKLQKIIEHYFIKQQNISKNNIDLNLRNTVQEVIDNLNNGILRVSEKINNKWITHQWIKKAIILFFTITNNKLMTWGNARFFDKCPTKFENKSEEYFKNRKIRIIPPATVRYGAYIANNTVIMPSYVNIGAYIDTGTMIDTWATIGSCAHIGKNTHISGGVGIGGVLEPIQANPTIIEDNCFIGARSEIAEGVIIEENSVLAMGVFISQSTKIYNRSTGHVHYGYVPSGSVVIPGSLPSEDGKSSTYCAIIVKTVDSRTKNKIQINNLLREYCN
ncbi:2,3,4,5-tetrahydropyridine-2-carboxylate N-succinyltransferase [Candidatus Blochmanniella floridana]|uniref:2,3,4,5-tetrahydropyridine-2,6-dicarboxylate N-succinyltransferase n=1 Tax=Blochmanniella floridana TaxID=203907 RepID=DAPD_BLOFL|nr:RecName: Full=2,3,4,5-tetrahydropyridine-2,6-dicarboxylate N-succinyltransferase; AltName: Full=Tetrahydrodipicolinate N-succinyltransferase; Short=THDP succinyltransferase; Short=THP succinyltransferase; Short=Tetrahydropicolinate succinylase [Candidatus Blochmannia floridanus]CAD83340.1 2,3,4,5-tetrahydropyridine-2-carboxylate N-succinyltransferase [Candidatus Blochmannia floridanus]